MRNGIAPVSHAQGITSVPDVDGEDDHSGPQKRDALKAETGAPPVLERSGFRRIGGLNRVDAVTLSDRIEFEIHFLADLAVEQ